ncbi:MAG TPA: alpha/beta fold hydrolase [Actinomycetes bacterium]|nr:alpha/beta fold hydrolase [Actinomycetes bacterium]
MNTAAPAALPPLGLPGLDPAWSRLVEATDTTGVQRTWHVLDAGPSEPVGTLLCVHGNPTWSYTFRSIVSAAQDRWRVVAPDHLGMGYSERTGNIHRLGDRIAELGNLTAALAVSGPVIIVAHDWGGAISLGWAESHPLLLRGVVLLNTAVSQPVDAPVPRLIQLARSESLVRSSTQTSPLFLRGTLRLAHPALTSDVAAAYRAPYATSGRRQAIADFVADIPLETDHPSRRTLNEVGDRLTELAQTPTLLIWGTRDPVFTDRYLRDLQHRLPHAETQRYERAGHLVVEDAPVAQTVLSFADGIINPTHGQTSSTEHAQRVQPTATGRRPLWSRLDQRADDETTAIVEMGRRGPNRTISWRQLHAVVRDLSAGLSSVGVAKGDRVAMLVPPGADLTAAVYSCWRAGAVPVIADAGLGLAGLRRALRSANVKHIIGVGKGLTAAKTMGLSGTFISAGAVPRPMRAALGIDYSMVELGVIGKRRREASYPDPRDEAVVLFTSGATGPAKGVVYRHSQLEAQRDVVVDAFAIQESDRLVAAFAPFALFGPALGISSAVPRMEVTEPGTLTARALADAVAAIDASLVFAAPAALRNVVQTAGALRQKQRESLTRVRLLLTAGAPVPYETLRAASSLMGDCQAHTPYGMTEAMPLCDVTLGEIEDAGMGNGVLVGRPLAGVQVAVSRLSPVGEADGPLTDAVEVTGEICVRAPHVKDHYDQLWSVQQDSARDVGWHRTGDVGHLDDTGRLWVEGRLVHVITTAGGAVTPVGIERAVEQVPDVAMAAAVGVGPAGNQVLAVVVEAPRHHPGVAPLPLIDAVRAQATLDVAAVLVVRNLPVDIRHNSKIDRARVADWASRVLAGDGSARL